MQKSAAKDFRDEAWQGTPHYNRSVDLRYRGQGYELNLPFTKNLLREFEQEHHRRYGYTHPDREVELVTLRLRAILKSSTTDVGKMDQVGKRADVGKMDHMGKMDPVGTGAFARPGRATLGRLSSPKVTVLFEGKKQETTIHSREDLRPSQHYPGPAIITEYSATTVIPPGKRFHLDEANNLIVSVRPK